VIDLELALTDLADHLDHPAGDGSAEALRRRLTAFAPGADRRRPVRALLIAAAVLAVVATGVVTIAPARHAVADWLGIGAVEVRRSDRPPVAAPSTTSHRADPRVAARRLAAARKAARFTIVTPSLSAAGALAGVEVDPRVPGGLVSLTYGRFTLVEIATDPTQPPLLTKLVSASTPVQHVTVRGRPGLWIAEPHVIAYVDRSGRFVSDTMRKSGPVLLWERGGVTYRIEGLRSLDDAQAVAASLS
jgi:hypothetical protein